MYQINPSTNRINQLTTKSFSELGFSERNHLQEWLANEPGAFGEELLIIQKEFDGFDETRERLDLLALDKDGNLVVIENKLDDSGRDVVWQALKYASYCSGLTKEQIVDIYHKYLEKSGQDIDAKESIVDFLDASDYSEVILNTGNQQRIIFVAAHFRKEVTSTALWLMTHGITIQCFRVTPYCLGEQLLLNVEQIIPVPETKELMIGMNAKEAEEKQVKSKQSSRYKIRTAFWQKTLEALHKSDVRLYDNISPGKDSWISAGCGLSSCWFALVISKNFARIEFYISRPSTEENKMLFDLAFSNKEMIESAFGNELHWGRLNHRKASRIKYEVPFECYDEENWSDLIIWFTTHLGPFEKAIRKILPQLKDAVK